MHPALSEVIQTFKGAQDLAVSTLRDRLGVRPPQSNPEWAKICYEMGLEELGQGIGVRIRPYGYGVELKFPGISIDFDLGDKGPPGMEKNRRFLGSACFKQNWIC